MATATVKCHFPTGNENCFISVKLLIFFLLQRNGHRGQYNILFFGNINLIAIVY